MCCVEAEFWLDGRGVNAIFMEAFTDLAGKSHVARRALALKIEVDLNVKRSDELGIRELPDVKVVARDDAVEICNILLDLVDRQVLRNSLEQDARCSFAEWNSRKENYDGNDERNEGVGVESPREIGEPDEQSSCNNTNIAQSIT